MAQHRPPKPLRLFVAATPSQEWRGRALALLNSMKLPEHKATSGDQLHLTLLFLGERRPGLLPDIIESVSAAARSVPAFVLEPVRLIALPERGMARLVAIETTAPTPLIELHRRLSARLVREEKLMSLEELHYQLSLKAAQALTIRDRGAVLPGFWADLVVYDLSSLYVDQRRMEIVHDMPNGDWRRRVRAGGYDRIMVNGVTTHIKDQPTGATPGQFVQVTTPGHTSQASN